MNSGPQFSIRRATFGDAAGIIDCLQSAFVPYRADYTDAAFADTVLTIDTVHERLTAMVVFVASTKAGEILGTIACNVLGGGEGHLRGMAVRPGWQGRGVAQRLLEAAESELRDRKCSRISLDTTAPLRRAVRFYERNGYRRSGIVADFFGMALIQFVKDLK
jgi:ribosomal protein S18 acetylase RimI-like enzyme